MKDQISYNKRKELLNSAIEWAKEVGKIQKEKLNTQINIESKSQDINLVTEVDQESEQLIKEKIEKKYPNHSILAEETGKEEKNSQFTWIIDPIDGTINYAHKFPIYCTSIALKHKKNIIIGCVHVPTFNDTYTAIKNNGAYKNGSPILVSNKKELDKAVIATGFPYDRKISERDNLDNLKRIIKKVGGIRRIGTAAFELCMVASGVFDGYWEIKMNPWDVAAGILIVKEAGGKALNLQKEEIETDSFVVAGNNKISNKIVKEISQIKTKQDLTK